VILFHGNMPRASVCLVCDILIGAVPCLQCQAPGSTAAVGDPGSPPCAPWQRCWSCSKLPGLLEDHEHGLLLQGSCTETKHMHQLRGVPLLQPRRIISSWQGCQSCSTLLQLVIDHEHGLMLLVPCKTNAACLSLLIQSFMPCQLPSLLACSMPDTLQFRCCAMTATQHLRQVTTWSWDH